MSLLEARSQTLWENPMYDPTNNSGSGGPVLPDPSGRQHCLYARLAPTFPLES